MSINRRQALAYWPNEKPPSIINGSWKPPPVRKVTSS
jgi:hypothetical protein